MLLGLGVCLLGVAAVIFLAVSWGSLGIGGRAAVMAGCTTLVVFAAVQAQRRGLDSTAEALALLAVGMGLLDAAGARSAGLADLVGAVTTGARPAVTPTDAWTSLSTALATQESATTGTATRPRDLPM